MAIISRWLQRRRLTALQEQVEYRNRVKVLAKARAMRKALGLPESAALRGDRV